MKQLHVFFSGHVQGVGFRYTTRQIANGFAITGWIKNLKNGKVELLAEGQEAELGKFLEALMNRMGRHIEDFETFWSEATNQFSVFEISYEL